MRDRKAATCAKHGEKFLVFYDPELCPVCPVCELAAELCRESNAREAELRDLLERVNVVEQRFDELRRHLKH